MTRPGLYELPFGVTLGDGARAGRRRGRRTRRCRRSCSAARPGMFVGPESLDLPLTFEDTRAAGAHARLGRGDGLRRHGRSARSARPHRGVLRRRKLRPVRAVPRRHRAAARAARAAARGRRRDGARRTPAPSWPSSARRCATRRSAASGRPRRRPSSRPWPGCRSSEPGVRCEHADADAIWFRLPPRADALAGGAAAPPRRAVALSVDGQPVEVPEGSTLLDACRRGGEGRAHALLPRDAHAGERVPRLCRRSRRRARARAGLLAQGRGRHEGADQLASACARRARSCSSCWPRRWTSRPPTSCSPLLAEYGADPARFGPAAATVAQPLKDDNDLYVRDYAKCVLCYKCVEACGTDAQNTFAIAVAGRGFHAHISTEFDVPLPESACVYCGNCIAVCPTGRAHGQARVRAAPGRAVGAGAPARRRHDLPVLRRRLHAHRARAGRPHRQGHVALRERRHAAAICA